ncbi:mediator complex, subunit Med5 [Lasiosphaeris hirsuta]|uniref:Mediator of RNA polymerase II transcription subunit 5 n=1 Tax=Lasiosphaeris hirsuta TaxID=260670 RepID=A0AA40E234_9PEZI|nr:mediator complex, subunit Med5 [Lasiosphaeris hirsuta]
MDGPATAGLPAAVGQWSKFLSHAERQRLDADIFATYVPILFSKHRLPPAWVAELLLRPTKGNQDALDPRVPQYLQVLLKQDLVDTASVLRALYLFSTSHTQAPQAQTQIGPDARRKGAGVQHQRPKKSRRKVLRWRSSYASEEVIFWRLAKGISQGTGITNGREAIEVVFMVTRWMALFTEAAAAFSRDAFGAIHSLQAKDEMESSRQAFMLLLLGVCENRIVLTTFGRPGSKGARRQLARSLEAFIPSVLQNAPQIAPQASQIATQLEIFRTQTLASFEPEDKKDAAVAEISSYMDSIIGLDSVQVPEIPIVNSRAGLYIYINAALVGRPLLEDGALFTYLNNRYQGDVETTAVQLILASFDVLANAVFRNEGSKTGHLLKSYVVNKVPLILGSLAASSSPMYPFNAEFCITQALGQVDTNVFPTLSGMFDMPNNSSFQDSVRQDFCFACQLHGLLSQAAIETLLGDITYQSLPDAGRYVKDALVQSCLKDLEKTQTLIGELDDMNGNVGAAAQTIVEVIVSLCRNKETMTLKLLCSQLASKPLSLDIILLFNKPQRILHPLCDLLDNWGGYDDDQGEYQPVYEEFGSILLLLLAFVYRYGLSPADLGIRSADSFVGRLLSRGHLSRPLEELTDQEKSHLNGWIHGLFDTEAGGLGDELMSSCPPQDFYLLMPTLFQQIVLALSSRNLTEELLKSGLEYLVDVLLLPSLVPAILYLSNHLWADGPQGQRAIIRILRLILQPNSTSNEASSMLSSVLSIVAKPLEHALRAYQRQDPKSQEVEPLLKALKENLPLSRRTGGTDHNELESWTTSIHGAGGAPGAAAAAASAAGGGLTAAIRHTVQSLIQWAQNPPLNGMPAPYTHRQVLAALKILGAKHLLGILLDELKANMDSANNNGSGSSGVAYDVATAIICAPDVNNEARAAAAAEETAGAFATPQPKQQRRLTLREALKAEADDWKKIQKTDALMAETVVRLYRRVEAQMALPPPPDPALLQSDLEGLGVGDVGGDALGDAMAAAAAAAAGDHTQSVADAMSLDTTGLDGVGMDLGLGAGDLGGLSATGSVGGLDLSDDIFSGLSGTDFGTDFTWDSMDLG